MTALMELLDVRDLLAQPGASRRLARDEAFEGIRTELAAVPEERPVRLELLLESVVEGILASGRVAGEMSFQCARCLRSFAHEFDLEVRELYAHEPDEEHDEYPIVEEGIDLEPMVRDAVILSMPFSPLCRPDCLGLCERCGGDRNLGECSCAPETDPRWAVLEGLQLEE